MKIIGTNMEMVRGDTEKFTVSCSDRDGNDLPFETGDTVYFTVKQSIYDTEKILQKVVTEFEGGKAIIEILPEDTKGLNFQVYKYDIQVVSSTGKITTVIKPSDFEIGGEVTYE